MVLGTASHVGKSLIAAAFCRLLAEAGERRRAVQGAEHGAEQLRDAATGGEIGRAQAAQAEAAGIEPHVDMNPILLKPMGGVSQVIVDGAPIGVMSARDYYAAKDRLWPRVAAAYDRLAARFDRIVLEGAGSPVEINLAEHDLTNLRMARHADAADRPRRRHRARGRLRPARRHLGAARPPRTARGWSASSSTSSAATSSLLDPGLDVPPRADRRPGAGRPALSGPTCRSTRRTRSGIDETATRRRRRRAGPDDLDVAVARLPGLSNFTDFWPLSRVPGVRVRYVERGRRPGPARPRDPPRHQDDRPRPRLAPRGRAGRPRSSRLADDRTGPMRPGDLRRIPDARPSDRRPARRRVGPGDGRGAGPARRHRPGSRPRRPATASRAVAIEEVCPSWVTRSTWARPTRAAGVSPGSTLTRERDGATRRRRRAPTARVGSSAPTFTASSTASRSPPRSSIASAPAGASHPLDSSRLAGAPRPARRPLRPPRRLPPHAPRPRTRLAARPSPLRPRRDY